MGEAGGRPLTTDVAWMLVRLHEHTRRIGALEDDAAILTEAAEALKGLVGAVGVAHYALEPGGLLLKAHAGLDAEAPPFPSALVVTSTLGGILAGALTPAPGAASMPLGESDDGATLIELLRAGPEGRVVGVLWIRREGEPLDAPARSTLSVLVDHVGIALRNARLLAEERRRAAVDDLTGLFGRAHFLREARREISRARRSGKPLSALMIDADHFKRINDDHGHAAGDEVLRALARTLVEVTRETDVVGRLGGEEFAVLLPEAAIEGACIAAERLRRAVAATLIDVAGTRLTLTVSVGVAEWGDGESTDGLLKRADAAMYLAKGGGRDRVERAEPAASQKDV